MSIQDALNVTIFIREVASPPDMGAEFMRDVVDQIMSSEWPVDVEVTTRRGQHRIHYAKIWRRFADSHHLIATIEEHRVELVVDSTRETHPVSSPTDALVMAWKFIQNRDEVSLLKVHALHGKPPKVHELKCAIDPYRELDRGRKLFEYRKNDRNFQVGDVLDLREFARKDIVDTPDAALYTGAHTRRLVTYVLRGPAFGVPEGYAVLSLGAMP